MVGQARSQGSTNWGGASAFQKLFISPPTAIVGILPKYFLFVCFSLFCFFHVFFFLILLWFSFFSFLFWPFSFLPVWLSELSMSFMVLTIESSRQSAMQVVLVTHTGVSLAPYTCAPLSGQDKQWAAARHHLGGKKRRRRRKAGIVFFQSESSTRTLLSSISLLFLLFNGQHCYQKSSMVC